MSGLAAVEHLGKRRCLAIQQPDLRSSARWRGGRPRGPERCLAWSLEITMGTPLLMARLPGDDSDDTP